MDVNETSGQHNREPNTGSQNNTPENHQELFKCTCCRCLLEKKKTLIFNENKYNFTNDIVRSSLST